MSRVRIGGAGGRRNVRRCRAAANSSVFKCALKVVIAAELFVTGDREFQTVGAVIANALDWKLYLSPADRVVVVWRISEYELVDDNEASHVDKKISRLSCFQSFICNQSGFVNNTLSNR